MFECGKDTLFSLLHIAISYKMAFNGSGHGRDRPLADGEMPWLTYPWALAEIDDMIAAADGDEAVLLDGHRDYLRERVARAGSFLID